MFSTKPISLILLAGGKGTRLDSVIPKQFLLLGDKPVALHSFEYFSHLDLIQEIIVVCEPSYNSFFSLQEKPLKFAIPGTRRQDSVLNGMQQVSTDCEIVCVHDAARPFIHDIPFEKLVEAAVEDGAAALGSKVTNTIKRCDPQQKVKQTVRRENLWEIQTPQAILKNLLFKGYETLEGQDVTDDVSIIEYLGLPVKIVESTPNNFKITTQEDFSRAEKMLALSHS